jgi:pyruvate kinase
MSIKKTKIIATIGPASRSQEVIEELLLKGANVFRLNFSHGTHEDHFKTIKIINAAGEKIRVFPGILADLQGPKIRTGITMNDKTVFIREGTPVVLTTKQAICDEKTVHIDYRGILEDVFAGEEILINDGSIRLKVKAVHKAKKQVLCVALTSGTYSSHKGVNFPNAKLKIPSFTEKDKKDLEFILKNNVQFIALSFVRCKEDVLPLSSIIGKSGKRIKIIVKIEKPEAEKNLDEILDVCDGVMVARGDLGVETSPYVVPLLQKNIIAKANKRGKSVIVATQMLESMITNAMPTRAESTDVANAVLDDTDAVMLSGETAMGKYPGLAVDTMAKIVSMTENSSYIDSSFRNLSLKPRLAPHSICEAAAWASRDQNNIPVIVFTMSGDTALYLSKIRNQAPIYAFSPSVQAISQCSLLWNTQSFFLPFSKNPLELQKQAEDVLLRRKLVKKGDLVVVISGTTPVKGETNSIRIKKIGEY